MNFSQRITYSVKRDAQNLENLAKASQHAKDVLHEDVRDLGASLDALKVLVEVIEKVFGSLEVFQGNYDEWMEELVSRVDAMKDTATLAQNSYIFMMDPINLAMAVNEMTIDKWNAAQYNIQPKKLELIRKEIEKHQAMKETDILDDM